MTTRPIDRLLAVMARLRDRENGCPWDLEQSFATIAPYTIEEAYEVADAIERGRHGGAERRTGRFAAAGRVPCPNGGGSRAFRVRGCRRGDRGEDGAAASACVRRCEIGSAEAQNEAWEAHKAAEREAAGGAASVLDGVALALPALLRAAKISRRAARIGFDWPDAQAVVPKIAEEIAEIEAELAGAARQAALEEEVGDLLFAAANLARKLERRTRDRAAPRHREIRAPFPRP